MHPTFKSAYSRLVTFDMRDFFYLRLFSFKQSFDFSQIICQNLHKLKKNLNIIHDICDIKYPRLLNFYNFATFSTRDF